MGLLPIPAPNAWSHATLGSLGADMLLDVLSQC